MILRPPAQSLQAEILSYSYYYYFDPRT